MSRRLVDCLLILLNARAYLNIAIESRFAPMMLLAVFKKVQYKLLMHRLAQMNVRFALMNSKRWIIQAFENTNEDYLMEQAISSLKAAVKADISRPAIQQEMNTIEMKQEIGALLWAITAHSCFWKL